MRTAQTTSRGWWEASPYLPQSWQTRPMSGAEPCPPPLAPGPRQLSSHGEVRRKQLSNPSILQMIRDKPEPLRRNKYKCFFCLSPFLRPAAKHFLGPVFRGAIFPGLADQSTLLSRGICLNINWPARKQMDRARAEQRANLARGCQAKFLRARETEIKMGGWKR